MAILRVAIPGPGGNLGECVVCGKSFITEILLGTTVQMLRIDGFGDNQLPCHDYCIDDLQQARNQWRNLPEGPLRRVFEQAQKEVTSNG